MPEMKLEQKRTWRNLEISSKAQEEYSNRFNASRNIIEVLEESVEIRIDDDYGEEPSKARLNEEIGVVFPIRERGNRKPGLTTALKQSWCSIVGDMVECCDRIFHNKRNTCPECGSDLVNHKSFNWRGIEVTSHCQYRFSQRANYSGKTKETLLKVLEKSKFKELDEECMCLFHEKSGLVFPIRNRDHKDGLGFTTTLLENMVDDIS
jgi:RNA polymerase subunit RPABC4/transcription elongation factor Spt4